MDIRINRFQKTRSGGSTQFQNQQRALKLTERRSSEGINPLYYFYYKRNPLPDSGVIFFFKAKLLSREQFEVKPAQSVHGVPQGAPLKCIYCKLPSI